MSGKFELKCKSELHNYFEIEVYEEGKLKQSAFAQNVITKNFFKQSWINEFSIIIGRGTGEPSPSDTALFSMITLKAARNPEHYVISEKDHSYGLKLSCNILPEEFIGEEITEIGIGSGGSLSPLITLTHAMIKDAEGNPITIHKGETDEIKISAHLITKISYPNEHCYSIIKGFGNIGHYLTSGRPTIYPITLIGMNDITFAHSLTKKHQSTFESAENSNTTTMKPRFNTDEGRGIAIHTLCLAEEIFMPVTSLPDWTGFDINGEVLGTGDSANTEFPISWWEPSNITVFKNNIAVESSEFRIEDVINEVNYIWKFIKPMTTTKFNGFNMGYMELKYKDATQDVFLLRIHDIKALCLFQVLNDDIELMSYIYDPNVHNVKSYGNIKTVKIGNQYYNIINNNFVPCSEAEVLSTVEDPALKKPFMFDNGNIRFGHEKVHDSCIFKKKIVSKRIVFNTPPGDNEEIKANYHVNYIPKDNKHILDVVFSIVKTAGQGS